MPTVTTDYSAEARGSVVTQLNHVVLFDDREHADNYARDLSLQYQWPVCVETEWWFYQDGQHTSSAVLDEYYEEGECIG